MRTGEGAARHANNACDMWASLTGGAETAGARVSVQWGRAHRVVFRRPVATTEVAAAIAEGPATGPLTVEDSFGAEPPPLPAEGTIRLIQLPIMTRAAAPSPGPPAVPVHQVGTAAELAVAERVIIEGFPLSAQQPWQPGRALSPRLLESPQWRIWLAQHDEEPAGAGLTYDDGTVVGFYYVTTLPEHRRRGVARAIMHECIAAYPERPLSLVSATAARPLYRSLGFTEAATSHWYVRSS